MDELKHTQKLLIVLVGPTAVGKTSLSLELAKTFNCPILSTDSRQFYKEMSIGTAKPSPEELSQAEHHFINSRSIHDRYTAGMFETDAINCLNSIYQKHQICVAVGGSGLYINALCYGIDDIPASEEIRERLFERLDNEGLEALQKEVKQIDPEFYEASDMKNPRRVMRALEVYEITGKKYSSFRNMSKKPRDFKTLWVGLEMDLQELYDRINKRVDVMMEQGLLDEVKSLYKYKDLKALKTVGYQEMIDHLDGKIDLKEAVELIKRNTRRFAKKQYTWFRKNEEIKWFQVDQWSEILQHIQSNK
ncbi:MAG: tRNA (adenosine(37)-N6)-dimethylallyltransferase MiaA [Crocinitomicaceae bacterium]|nr:tRNA (adenosine(37)-N6)-dimethylallyltransferase MiaA [Crocinitomicaceae bacterium]